MALFEVTIALLVVGAILSLFADRMGVPYPALLALAGTLLALVPGTPTVTLDPELALALFVAPVLVDAAYDASPRDLRTNLVPVSTLAILLVGVTIAAVAVVVRMIVPSMPLAAAIALGAIVAPPDASAAAAVLKKLRPPHRLMIILEGESLFNDASALLAYRVAVGAAMTGAFSGWSLVPTLLLTCGGGAIVGILLARAILWLTMRITDLQVSIIMQFVASFAVWILADRLGLSAIITTVAFAMTAARIAPGRVGGRARISAYAVWDVVVFVMNVLAFVLIGLQLRGITQRIEDGEWRIFLLAAGAVCLTAILVRVVWVMSSSLFLRWKVRHFGIKNPLMKPSLRGGLLISWSGMRGIVTLAAALALPGAFPHRDLIVFCAFCVVLATLVVQGATLGPLMRRLGLRDDGSVERELSIAREETAKAALAALDGSEPRTAADILRREYQARIRPDTCAPEALAALQQRAVEAQRRALLELRAREVIGDDAFHAAEEEIDLLELTADPRVRPNLPTT
ncbi:MAG TPA: cation:proton antiporter [Steroidobacteraceae bacterium]|jgi:Na+/H+ antiporter|nr:cation:proton antiporter [Steroidobacteraceae bacterium]